MNTPPESEPAPVPRKKVPISTFFGLASTLTTQRVEQAPLRNVQIAHALQHPSELNAPAELDPDFPSHNPLFAPELQPDSQLTDPTTDTPTDPIESCPVVTHEPEPDPPRLSPDASPSPFSWDQAVVDLAHQPIPTLVTDIGAAAHRLWFGHLRPSGSAHVDADSYYRIRHASVVTGVPVCKLATYLLATGLPKPSKATLDAASSMYADDADILRRLRRIPSASMRTWTPPPWLNLIESWPQRHLFLIRFFPHPYLRVRLDELDQRTNRRKYAMACIIQATLPRSPTAYQPKRR